MKEYPILQWGWRSALVVALLFLGVNLAQAQDGMSPQPEQSQAPAASVGTGFTYQGRLEKDGMGINDACDFKFSSHSDATLDQQNGQTQTVSGVVVKDGYFTVVLNANGEFGYLAFSGAPNYLEVEVKCSGDSIYVPLTAIKITDECIEEPIQGGLNFPPAPGIDTVIDPYAFNLSLDDPDGFQFP